MLTCRLMDNIKMDLKVIHGVRVQMDSRLRAEVLTTVSVDVSVCSSVAPYSPAVHKASKNLGKVKCTLVQALRLCTGRTVNCTLGQAMGLCTGRTAYRGSRGIALPFYDHSTNRGEGSASRPVRSLPPGKTQCSLYRRLGGPQSRSGQVRKISPPPGFVPRTKNLGTTSKF
jgi:hypothetical protein